jgi:hypothetical protein
MLRPLRDVAPAPSFSNGGSATWPARGCELTALVGIDGMFIGIIASMASRYAAGCPSLLFPLSVRLVAK